jgi:hypothetical protein
MIQHPTNISQFSKANACFYMFVDEETEVYVKNSSSLYSNNKIGLWRLVVVHNLPYQDPRRTGKVLSYELCSLSLYCRSDMYY